MVVVEARVETGRLIGRRCSSPWRRGPEKKRLETERKGL